MNSNLDQSGRKMISCDLLDSNQSIDQLIIQKTSVSLWLSQSRKDYLPQWPFVKWGTHFSALEKQFSNVILLFGGELQLSASRFQSWITHMALKSGVGNVEVN
jgi:hypothetical protein